MLYFAYGSNMNHAQMKERCPSSKFVKAAYLENAKFVYDGYSRKRQGAVANIVACANDKVWGGIFEITDNDLSALDVCEGYPTAYGKSMVNVKDSDCRTYCAWTYFRVGQKENAPSDAYRKVVIRGAQDCSLPSDYMDNLWARVPLLGEEIQEDAAQKPQKKEHAGNDLIATVIAEHGLCARPSALFIKMANKFKSEIRIAKGSQKVNGKSIMGVLMLAAGRGQTVSISAKGDDAAEVIKAIENLKNHNGENVFKINKS